MFRKISALMMLSIIYAFADDAIVLTSPNGGDVYNGEDTMTISWTADPLIKEFNIYASSDNEQWFHVGETSATTFKWHVP